MVCMTSMAARAQAATCVLGSASGRTGSAAALATDTAAEPEPEPEPEAEPAVLAADTGRGARGRGAPPGTCSRPAAAAAACARQGPREARLTYCERGEVHVQGCEELLHVRALLGAQRARLTQPSQQTEHACAHKP